jgi:hypothetical protein
MAAQVHSAFNSVFSVTQSNSSFGQNKDEIAGPINLGSTYTNELGANGFRFSNAGNVLIVISVKELSGMYGGLNGDPGVALGLVEHPGLHPGSTIVLLNLDVAGTYTGDMMFNHIIFVRHNGTDGSGWQPLMDAFTPGSALMQSLTPHLAPGGDVWMGMCFGTCYEAKHPGYFASVSETFGNANVHYTSSFGGWTYTTLLSRTRDPSGGPLNQFLDYQVFNGK